MVDRSGSMHHPRITLAVQSAYVTSRSLETLPGITHCIGVFPGEDTDHESDITLVKDFDERCKPEQFVNICTDGGTPMAEAALWAGMMLTHSRQTDGSPSIHRWRPERSIVKRKKSIDRLRWHGIEVYVVLLSNSGIRSRNRGLDGRGDVTVIIRLSSWRTPCTIC